MGLQHSSSVGELMNGIDYRKTPGSNKAFQVRYNQTLIAEIERPKQTTFNKQIDMVLSWAELRNERATEILAQIDPQYAFRSSIVFMRSDRHRDTFELINLMLQLCVYVEMRLKHALACWRPVEYNAQIQPMITTPGHDAFPSGHATHAHAVAHVLKALLKPDPANPQHGGLIDQLHRQAARIATNRVIAGVHFPSTAWQGACRAMRLANFSSAVARRARDFMAPRFMASGGQQQSKYGFQSVQQHSTADSGPFYSEDGGPRRSGRPRLAGICLGKSPGSSGGRDISAASDLLNAAD